MNWLEAAWIYTSIKVKGFVKSHHATFWKVLFFCGIGALLVDTIEMNVLKYVAGTAFIVIGYSHGARKGLFPYIKLETLVNKAKEEPLPAAIVFAAVVYILAEMMKLSFVLLTPVRG